MQIVTLQTKDFKGLKNDIYEFTMDNTITGRNGSGKSSIADAIIFCLYGRTRTGNSSTSELIHESAESTKVALQFSTGTTVLREESRFYGTRIELNGETVDAQTLEANLPEHKTFLTAFLTGYFSELDESDQRSLLLSFAGDIDLKKLFKEYTRRPELIKAYNIDLSDLDKESKKFRKREKDIKDEILSSQHKRSYAEEQIKSLKKPKARVDVEKVQAKLELHEAWDDYEEAVATNNRIGEQILAATKGRCPDCNQELPEDQRAARLKELGAQRVEAVQPKSKRPKTAAYELREQLSDAKATNALYDNYEEQVLDFEAQKVEASDKLEKLQKELVDISAIVEALSPKGIRAQAARKQIQPILDTINKYSDDKLPVQIETLHQLKNGNLKEVFRLSANSVPYKWLSTGERKRVDIAIAQAVNELDNNSVDMFFIDDAELISESFTIAGQIFKTYVASESLTIKEG